MDKKLLISTFANLLEIANNTTLSGDAYKKQEKLVANYRNELQPFMATMPMRHFFQCEQCHYKSGAAIHHFENPAINVGEQSDVGLGWGKPAGLFIQLGASELHKILAHGEKAPKEFEQLLDSVSGQ